MFIHIFLEKCMKILDFDRKIILGDGYYFLETVKSYK